MAAAASSSGSTPRTTSRAPTAIRSLEGPLPVAKYHATLKVSENAGGLGCTVEWSSEFEAAGAPASEAEKVIRGVYEAGFNNLRKMFGGGVAAARP